MISCSSKAEIYDTVAGTWSSAAQPLVGRSGGVTVANGGYVYTLGGHAGAPAPYTRVDRYDPSTDSWTTVASMDQSRDDFCAASVGEYIYAMGSGGGGGYESARRTAERYHVPTDTWSSIASYPSDEAYFHHRCAAVGTQLKRIQCEHWRPNC